MTQGAAKTNDFMLGSATIMLGPQADLFDLMTDQSVGLVKNVAIKTTPGFVELTQGVRNSLVYSVMNSNTVGITAEMFEYTPSNIAYGLSLDGSAIVRQTAQTTTTTLADADDTTITLTLATGFASNDYILIKTPVADNVLIRKITLSGSVATLDSALPFDIPAGSTVEKCNVLAVGAQETAPFLAAKIVGTLADGSTVPMLFPKVRIESGLSMAFKTDNFDNIPFELDIFDLVTTDPHYAYFSTIGPGGTAAKGMILD